MRRRVMEARFRRKASTKDGEKVVQCESESSDKRSKKRKEKKRAIVTPALASTWQYDLVSRTSRCRTSDLSRS